MLGLVKIFECPYCRRDGEGIIAVDFDAARPYLSTDDRFPHCDIYESDPNGVILFNPDGRTNRVCPHLIAMLVDVSIGTKRDNSDISTRHEYTGNFDHQWIRSHDLDYSVHLWETVNSQEDTAFIPTTPHEVGTIDEQKDGRGEYGYVSGTIFVAMEPDRFFQELHHCFWAQQEYWSRKQ